MPNKRKLQRGEQGEQMVAEILNSDPSFHRLINNLVLLGGQSDVSPNRPYPYQR